MAGNIYIHSCILLIYIVFFTSVFVDGYSLLTSAERGSVFYKSCDILQAFSVTYEESFEKCVTDCQHLSDCALLMFQHRMKQCAFFDTSVNINTFAKTESLCMYTTVSKKFSNRTVCKSSEKFDILTGQCYSSDCPNPDKIEHAELLSATTKLGSSSRYKCNPGYTGVGNPKIVCQTNSMWSFTNFSCIDAYCPAPSTVENTAPYLLSTFRLGSSVRYACMPGYVLSGNPEIQCQLNATWSSANFSCSNCPTPKYISNAVLQSTDTHIGTTTRYECNPGSIAIGNPEIHCQTNASWTHTDLVCEIVCSTPTSVSNAHLISVEYVDSESELYKTGTRLTYACEFGFHGEGNSTSNICDEYGKWVPKTVMCCMNGTVSKASGCYKAFSVENLANYSEVTEMCSAFGFIFVSPLEYMYNVLVDKGENLAPWMLYHNTKSQLQVNLFQSCLSEHLNTTDLENYREASYEETRLKIIENEWDKGGYPGIVNRCSLNLVNDWYPGEPNGNDTENCIALGPLSDFMYKDIRCEFLHTNPVRKEDIGFLCKYTPPSV